MDSRLGMGSGDQITVEMRLAAIEDKLDRLLAHLGVDDDGTDVLHHLDGPFTAAASAPAVPAAEAQTNAEAQIRALIQAGKKIQAIKAYREATGQGLKEAKNAVEAMERSMKATGGRR